MDIAFDSDKAVRNRLKHGVSFAEAEAVLYDPLALTREDDHAVGERRYVTVGMGTMERLLTVVWTQRGKTVRLISARQATTQERKDYEN